MKKLIYFLCFSFIFAQRPSVLNHGFQPFNSKPYLTPTYLPTRSIYINWNTMMQESSIVAYGLTLSLEDTVKTAGIRNYHHIILSDLIPATEYLYRILPNGDVRRFRTFPSRCDSFTFVIIGDTRSDSAIHQSVIDCMAEYEFELILHTGDLVHNGDNTDAWRTFFNVEDTLLQNKHFLPTIGNHEHPYWQYDTLFALPGAEYFYSTTYGNTHFIMLNTHMDLYIPQRNWLINELIAVSNDSLTDWIIVALHRPPYSSGSHGSQKDVREAWCSIFEEYGVDVVFCGHDHSYERTQAINGVVYVVSAGGGAPLYEVGKNDWTAYSNSIHHFCRVEILKNRLVLKTITSDGVVIDSLTIKKD